MKRFVEILMAALLVLAVSGCKKQQRSEQASLKGCWELSSFETKSIDYYGETVSVYLEFSASSFELYQKIGEGHYRKFTGNYTFAEGKLSGKYSDGTLLGSVYEVTVDEKSLSLASEGGKEVDVYTKISQIPSSVISDVLE